MPKIRLPLTGQYNTRIETGSTNTSMGYVGIAVVGIAIVGKINPGSTKDRRFINCFSHTIDRKKMVYRRPGFSTSITPSAGNTGSAILIWTGQGTGQKIISAFGATNSTIYDSTTSLGAITGVCNGITETFVSTESTLVLSSGDSTAWTTSSTSVTYGIGTGLTFVGDTNTNTIIDNITVNTATLGLVVGQLLTGTGFAANTRIASIDSATQITLDTATTATNAGVTITRTIFGKIIDADFPGNASLTLAGTFAHMDGYAFIMTTNGVLWASDLNTVTAWTATSFDSANSYPDKGVGCVRYKNFIMAFGTESVEFFYNAGLTPFPLTKSTSMTIKIGAASANAIAQISDVVFWCGSTPQGGLSIFKYDGSVQRISTPEIDAILIIAGPSATTLTTVRFYGLSFVLVRGTQATFVYCIEENNWHEWTSNSNLWYKCVGLSIGTSMANYSISNTSTDGKVYTQNPATYVFTDDSASYTATIQTMSNDFGKSERKFCSELDIICDRETSTSTTTISYSDDDFQTFTTWGTVDLSDERPRATRLGGFNKRAWRLENSSATPMRIEALELMIEVGQ